MMALTCWMRFANKHALIGHRSCRTFWISLPDSTSGTLGTLAVCVCGILFSLFTRQTLYISWFAMHSFDCAYLCCGNWNWLSGGADFYASTISPWLASKDAVCPAFWAACPCCSQCLPSSWRKPCLDIAAGSGCCVTRPKLNSSHCSARQRNLRRTYKYGWR